MNQQKNPLFWSFPIGTWFLTQVRVSVLLPIVVLLVCWRLENVQLGMIFAGVLFVSVLAHEFGHVLAARNTGGYGDEILLWPIGGVAFVQTGLNSLSRYLTPAAGPLFNGVFCLGCLPAVLNAKVFDEAIRADAFNPFVVIPAVSFEEHILLNLLVLTFSVNWMLLLINLLPVHPLDGGRILQTALVGRLGSEFGIQVFLRVGFLVGGVAMVAGVMYDQVWVLLVGSVCVLLNMHEFHQLQTGGGYDESFMGYDFSQGYTSLEQNEVERPPRRPGPIGRWREERRRKRDLQIRQEEEQAESQLDALLEKVHLHGMGSLTEAEKRLLSRASDRMRNHRSDEPAE